MRCDECGDVFEPMTDAFKCPTCGTENYPEDDDPDQGPYRPALSPDKCNVCGIPLRTFDEERMGMCDSCASE